MYFLINMNLNKLPRIARITYRRKLVRKVTILTILVLIYEFLVVRVIDPSSEPNSTFYDNSLDQTTIPIEIKPDVIPDFQLTELTFTAAKNSIFFIKTTNTGHLSSRQACSVESAARANPDRNISVIYIEPVPRTIKFVNLAIQLTGEYKNVVFYRAPVSMLVENTPLKDKDEESWPVVKEHALTYLAFYNFGGTYLELDMIVTRSFASLPKNWVVRENNESLAIGAMSVTHADSGYVLAMTAANELWKNFSPKNWTRKMVRVITRAMKRFCTTQNVTEMSAATCQGIKVLDPESFYPISFWPDIFYPDIISEEPYAYHFWDDLSKRAYIGRNTLFDKLATKFCPNVYYYFLRSIF